MSHDQKRASEALTQGPNGPTPTTTPERPAEMSTQPKEATPSLGLLHPKCGKRFPSGSRAGHCGSCCETFIGLQAFEAHRTGSFTPDTRRCKDLFDGIDDFWQDERGYWHHGPKLTDEQKTKLWPKKNDEDPA